jgi:small multidrug resistance pump
MYALGILLAAVSIEVASTSALPRTREFHDPLWSALVIAGFAVSMWLVTIVIRTMSVSTTYAIWSGLGTALVAVVGALFLGEQLTVARALCLGLIIAGVVGLNLVAA